MINFDVWKILGVITVILLIVFRRGRNALWGGLTLGSAIGLIVAIFICFKGRGFNWSIIGKGAISGVMIGFIAELLGKVSDKIKRAKK